MSDETKSRAVAPALAVVFVVAVLIAADLLLHGNKRGASQGEGFQERAQQAGIAFRMSNLPNEQGEQRFRINLYDHGAGLAVGDYDNDGRDDIYFLNQHGQTALYRNRGDGTFEDVTAKAGVALDGRVSVGATFADYDNDGWEDLFVTTTRAGNVLFH
ncbi:MAG TPA: VCBS repeat-containing protein, partial [Gemmatimonadaceae bacterium]|nr:VCBS repeat-containing protein [Gemmatimonadaceae bacterium]